MRKIITFGILLFFCINGNSQCWESANNTGSNLSAAIKTDGTLWAWGKDTPSYGVNSDRPVQIGTDNDWKIVSCGWNFRVALKDNGTLWYWGRYPSSQTTNGITIFSNFSLPTQLGTDTDWKFIDCSGEHCLAIKLDGSLWGWGGSFFGQLGLGSFYTNIIMTPTRIGTNNDWKTAVGYSIFNNGYNSASSFAIKTNGTLWAWGSNESGQLGDGTSVSKNAPVQIGIATDWMNVYSSWHTTLALKTNGTLWATGVNPGTFGNGTNTSSNTFIQIGTDTNWKSLAVGRYHSLGTKTDGSLWAWGDNQYSAFGTGNDTDSLIPIRVGAENDWELVSVAKGIATANSQALKSDGTLWAWGHYSASLGIGTFSGGVRSYPDQISCNSLGNEIFSDKFFTIYPNPVSEIINIQNPYNIKISQVVIYDVTGKKIVDFNGETNQINISQIEKGIYLIQIKTEEGIHQQKIIKQ